MAPNQWLLDLETTSEGYASLLAETGSLALAAYRLACAQCHVRPVPSPVPTRLELGVAASMIVQNTGLPRHVPCTSELALDCEEAGFPVL